MSQSPPPQRWFKAGVVLLFPFLAALVLSLWFGTPPPSPPMQTMSTPTQLLTDPFLQYPTANSVRVVWFTEFAGTSHRVQYGENFAQSTSAQTRQLSRVREGKAEITYREIWRHEAEITGLTPNQTVPYQVLSETETGETLRSGQFTLAANPTPGTPLKILLTSDHQMMPMTAANLQKVEETVGKVDGVFLAGDLVNIPDRASEWFDHPDGNSFFPCLQGRANYGLEKNGTTTVYQGGEIIQNAPLFPTIGNHEVMGRFSMETGLNQQFNDPYPRDKAAELYQKNAKEINPRQDPKVKESWIKANSYNTDTYQELFSLPASDSGGKKYYAVTFGDIRLIVLYITNIWRVPGLGGERNGRYAEATENLNSPEKWGYGQHIFEPITPDSRQYEWLKKELNRPEFQEAKYKIVMFHHPPHTLGGNIVPAYTNPRQLVLKSPNGEIQSVRYEYPLDDDHIQRYVMPLLNEAKVNLVYYGHSHLWNRFVNKNGVNFLESSNVGNSYGAYLEAEKRPIPDNYQEIYVAQGDPYGLQPIMPTLAPLVNENDQFLPYIASNDITAFSILETEKGIVSSYYFDTTKPGSEVVKFDEFSIVGK
ncbi:metallophosphoesterase [Spirulina sp. CS-785/01]|uniref:metallophosphoesterase n=1 Tax=Spirulina sp. CS-785/01 TaxID=3021716 RepID=UPI00232B50B6|nr:metallophosphoesterase [Spirulina sp. CS-785/01]MDB9314353.1 metallophosphoesterase [Spirulina sp. CS-785/01]